MKVAIIGAGIAGLSCAAVLKGAGADIVLFDKGRGPGGRMSTRRATVGEATVQFDHGAQYFTARDPAFVATVAAWEASGIVARWPAAGADAWVGVPAMNAPVRVSAQAHDVRWGSRIETVGREGDTWRLDDADERYDALVVAVPAEQVAALTASYAPHIAARAETTRSDPCWTLMVAFDSRIDLPGDCLRGDSADPIGWAARNSAKPGRDALETWVVQAGALWSARHLEMEADAVADLLLAALAERAGVLPGVLHKAAHRWRYARTTGRGDAPFWDRAIGLGVCGDWLAGPRVESAWLSGHRLGRAMIG